MPSRIDTDLFVNGNINSKTLTIPAGTVTNASVLAAAGIASSKLQHKHRPNVAQPHGSAGTTERRVIHVVAGVAGVLNSLRAVVPVIPIGAATHSIQLKKNGSNILTAPVVIDNANVTYTPESYTGFTSTVLAAGDVLEVDITATAGGGTLGQGLCVTLDIDEDAV